MPRAEREGAEIHWGDETGVAADEHPRQGYARRGQPARMDVPDPHIRVNVVASVSNQGTLRFMTYHTEMTAALLLVFLGRLVRAARRKIFLILDHHPAHEVQAVEQWLASRRDRIEVFALPRRSPELKAEEYLNNDLKANVHDAGLPNSKEQLRTRVQTFLHELLHWPEHVMSYFQHPCVHYAAGS